MYIFFFHKMMKLPIRVYFFYMTKFIPIVNPHVEHWVQKTFCPEDVKILAKRWLLQQSYTSKLFIFPQTRIYVVNRKIGLSAANDYNSFKLLHGYCSTTTLCTKRWVLNNSSAEILVLFYLQLIQSNI